MKNVLFLFLFSCLIAGMVTAAPPMPFIVYGHVDWNDQLLSGARVQLTDVSSGKVVTVTTNDKGYWQEDAGNWATYNGQIDINVLDGCGSADTCTKSIKFNTDYAVVDFSVTGALSSCVCPSCSGGGGGGCSYSESTCRYKFPCPACTETVCPSCPTCVPTECPSASSCEEKVCPSANTYCGEIDEICPVELVNFCSLQNGETKCDVEPIVYIVSGVIAVLFAIAGLVLGGYTWFPGLKGLANYSIQQGLQLMKEGKFEEAKKKIDTGLKTMQTAVTKAKDGAYK